MTGLRAIMTGADLAAAVAWADRIRSHRPNPPILGGFLLEGDDDGLRISVTDFETFGRVRAKATVTASGAALVPGALLAAVAKSAARAADVELIVERPTMAAITAGRSRWTVPLMPVEDYPKFPEAPSPVGTVDGAAFARAIRRTVLAVDATAPMPLTGAAHLELAGDRLALLATDRYRVADLSVPWTPAGVHTWGAGLPVALLELVARVASGPVTIQVTGGVVGFSTEGFSVIGREVADYPDRLRRSIPFADPAGWVVVDAGEVLAAVEAAQAVTEGRPLPVVLEFTEDRLGVSLAGDDRSGASDVAVSDSSGPLITVTASARYVADAVRSASTETLRIGVGETPNRAVSYWPLDEEGQPEPGFRHLTMPIKGVAR